MIVRRDCTELPHGDKLTGIETFDPAIYNNMEGLTGDICRLGDRKEKAGDSGIRNQLSMVGEGSLAPRYVDNPANESHLEGLTFAIWRIIM